MELADVDRTEVRVAACTEIDMEMDPQCIGNYYRINYILVYRF